MRLKKKIIRKSFDYKAAQDYYAEACVCPNCGNHCNLMSLSDKITAMTNNTLSITSSRLASGGFGYECRKCGCQWEVKAFK